ncbi:unnamed protein product [Urochloa humidicola]
MRVTRTARKVRKPTSWLSAPASASRRLGPAVLRRRHVESELRSPGVAASIFACAGAPVPPSSSPSTAPMPLTAPDIRAPTGPSPLSGLIAMRSSSAPAPIAAAVAAAAAAHREAIGEEERRKKSQTKQGEVLLSAAATKRKASRVKHPKAPATNLRIGSDLRTVHMTT